MIDIRKPLIPQVKKMNNKEFMAFVRRPRQLDSQDGIILFAQNDEKEKRDYMTNLCIIPTIILIMLGVSFFYSTDLISYFQTFALWFTIGVLIFWTYMEYFQHRFILHRELNLDPNEPWSEAAGERNAYYFSRHIHHHVFMNQKYRIVLDLKSYALYMCSLVPPVLYMAGPVITFTAAAGLLVGSLLYDYFHMAFHFPEEYGNFEWSWF